MYFTQEHEEAIIKYALTDDIEIRTELYEKFIRPSFNEMVDKIVYTYKFSSLPNIDDLRQECKVWLTTILDKYDSSKGSKAFSYFSVITKNWFIHKVKQNSKRNSREVNIQFVQKEIEEKYAIVKNVYVSKREKKEFWHNLWEEINSWENLYMKDNEKKVYEAVKIVLSSIEDIEIFNKKAVYLYLRELTGLNTKQIVNHLNKMRARYRNFKKDWDDGKI